MKKSNILQLLEMHVDKIVLSLMILISLVLLWKYVIGNPYGVEVDGDKRGPGAIDTYVKSKAEMLLEELEKDADLVAYNKTYLADYEKLVRCPMNQLSSLAIPYPGTGETAAQENRMYAIPEIPQLNNLAAAHLRGAAQIPVGEIRPENPYPGTEIEAGDIDLVTVSATVNFDSLFNAFQQSFMGPRLSPAWRDAALATPVFARLELERRELADDGTWSQWSRVPRTKIDMYKKLLEELPLTTDQMQFAVNIMANQFADPAVQSDILQPQAYSFLISRSEWMPPAYLIEALSIIEKEYVENIRKFRQEQNKLKEDLKRPEGTARQTTRQQPQPRQRTGREQNMLEPAIDAAALQKQTLRKERTVADVKADMQKSLLGNKEPKTMRDSLLVWAHDDTVQPGAIYQYRLRLGVFNPIAGTDWFKSDQAKYKEQVVLWSNYTQPTSDVYVPKRVHVFPLELIAAKNSPNGTEGVKVEVAKYNLGQWCTQTFDVFPGQIIGQKAEYTPKASSTMSTGSFGPGMPTNMGMGATTVLVGTSSPTGVPQIVDFTTPYMMVDINRVVSWGPGAQRRNTVDVMLYHDPQKQMRQAGIGKSNWDSDLREEESQVKDEMERGAQQATDGMSPIQSLPPVEQKFMPGF